MDFVGKKSGSDAVRALDDVTIRIPDGCVYGFLGSNGAGKSTLMRLMCGVYKMQQGSITIDGKTVWNNPEAKSDIFFINDETVQYADFTMKSLAKFFASFSSCARVNAWCFYPYGLVFPTLRQSIRTAGEREEFVWSGYGFRSSPRTFKQSNKNKYDQENQYPQSVVPDAGCG